VIAFRRWGGGGEYLVVGSLAERPYDAPSYRIAHPALSGSAWRERINSDGRAYGGSDVGNAGATLTAAGDAIDVVVSANGVIVLERTA
jgi:hypothetical protein